MAKAAFYNKKLLGYTDTIDFTDYQGIGTDPLYKRYNSVESVVKNHILPQYQSFLSAPYYDNGNIEWYVDEWKDSPKKITELQGQEKEHYQAIKDNTIKHYQEVLKKLSSDEFTILNGALKYINDEFIYCYDDKVVLIAWGMCINENKHTSEGRWFKTIARFDKKKITFDLGAYGKLDTTIASNPYTTVISRDKGYILKAKDIPVIISSEGYEFIGWNPNPIDYVIEDDTTFTAKYREVNKIEKEFAKVRFDAGDNGYLGSSNSIDIEKGSILNPEYIPIVTAKDGFIFDKWEPNINTPIHSDTVFTAKYSREMIQYTFLAGEYGELYGNNVIQKTIGTKPAISEIPTIKANRGYRFIGWDTDPLSTATEDKVYTAQYEEIVPWYKRFWLWLTGGKGCLKWLLWLLLFILLLLLLSWLFRGCDSHSFVDRNGNDILPVDDTDKIEQITLPDGSVKDNNGSIVSIIGDDGRLPDNAIVAPILDDGNTMPPIVSNPGAPDVIDNRLNIYFEDENADLNKWAKVFKEIYQSDAYSIIGYDPNVRMIQIQIPEGERNKMREELPMKIYDQEFFIVDESIMVLHGNRSQSKANKGWHLKATHVKEAWDITQGDPNLVVAIIDDGIDVNHSMFKGRFFMAYNVFTQNRNLSAGEGHGTHVAGLAVGDTNFYSNGAAGVAPNCKIMPVQVFDNGMCTFSSLASGIMYAIHNGANIVNISVGPSFKGLDQLPIKEQINVAKQYFKNEEKVYRHIIKIANEKNVILVFAAGNDNIVTAILPECRLTNNTINVAASTPEYKSSKFTNYSLGTNVSAPGEAIYSAYPQNSFTMFDGTSMAAPIVTGTVALMKTIKPDITVKQCIAVLQKTGKELDNFIPPMVLIDKALKAVKNGDIPSEPIWSHSLENHSNENIDNSSGNQTVDDYKNLKELLKKLKEQRDELNKKINDLESKIK